VLHHIETELSCTVPHAKILFLIDHLRKTKTQEVSVVCFELLTCSRISACFNKKQERLLSERVLSIRCRLKADRDKEL
jgi:hypothetical protein